MSRKTIADAIKDKMTGEGYEFVGQTSGQYSLRQGSNLTRKLEQLGLTPDQVEVELGAKEQHRTEGHQLLIFRKP